MYEQNSDGNKKKGGKGTLDSKSDCLVITSSVPWLGSGSGGDQGILTVRPLREPGITVGREPFKGVWSQVLGAFFGHRRGAIDALGALSVCHVGTARTLLLRDTNRSAEVRQTTPAYLGRRGSSTFDC